VLTPRATQEETFGPVVGIMRVPSDDAALALMNDSPYGLTASVWTDAAGSEESARVFEDVFAQGLEAGTVFLNRWALLFRVFRCGAACADGEVGATTSILRLRGRV
jgi:acyl-CoA reductase-like NAD-dependent aldehyde dehydrogenase